MKSLFVRIGSDLDVGNALHDMLRDLEIDHELKRKDILNAMKGLHEGHELFLQRTY